MMWNSSKGNNMMAGGGFGPDSTVAKESQTNKGWKLLTQFTVLLWALS
jgi:hypothetical protein